MGTQPSITVKELMFEMVRQELHGVPMEVLRLGDRQYHDLVDECETMPGSHKWDKDEPLPRVDRFLGIPIERVESPDYLYIGER